MSTVFESQSQAGQNLAAMRSRLDFQRKLQAVTNTIHATSNIDEIMLELSRDICDLFEAERLTIYVMSADKTAIVSKIKTGLSSFSDLLLPVNKHSIAGFVALTRKLINLRDVYDDNELRSHDPDLRALKAVDRRTGYHSKQMLVAPVVGDPDGEPIGVVQLINTRADRPFSPIDEEGVTRLAETLAIALRQRCRSTAMLRGKYDHLVAGSVLSADELQLATRSARRRNLDIEDTLMDEFRVKPAAIGEALSHFFRVPYESFKRDRIKPIDLLRNLKRDFVENSLWLPIEETPEGLVLLTTDPERVRASNVVCNVFPRQRLVYKVCTRRDFRATLDQFFGFDAGDASSIGELLSTMDGDADEEGGGAIDDASLAQDNELVQLVNKIVVDAYHQGASDIHIEPYPGKGKTEVRFRKDGTLHNYISVPASYRNAIVARLKIMCDLDISEKRKPQDGKIQFRRFGPLDIELRVATIPSAGGVEDIVIRILGGGEPIPLDELALSKRNLETLKRLIAKPYGLFFVCGPTGSGKTTDAAFRARLSEHAGDEDLDRGRSRRDHAEGTAPGPGEPQGWPQLRRRDAGVPAGGPGHHHGRRNARQGDHRDRHRGVAHRASRVRHVAYEQRAGVDRPPARHGDGPLQHRRRPARRSGAAPGQAAVLRVQGAAPGHAVGAEGIARRVLRRAEEHGTTGSATRSPLTRASGGNGSAPSPTPGASSRSIRRSAATCAGAPVTRAVSACTNCSWAAKP